MNKLLIKILLSLAINILCSFATAQIPFLERRPFVLPQSGQYPVRNTVDHQYPSTNIEDGTFIRFDGSIYNNNVTFPSGCNLGVSCYDGHAGTDYFMPFNTAIVAPAAGYVIWASFSDPANPCPGGIDPNGDQGTVIIAHNNSYYSCYLHLNPPLNVSVGQNVETGDTLGYNGNSGCAVNAHLHFEIRKDSHFFDTEVSWAVDPYGWWGNNIDPITELRGNRSEWLWVSSDVVDDGDNGFQRNHGSDWTYLGSGYNNDSWTAPTVHEEEDSRYYAIWVPWIESAGEYRIEIFVPGGVDATNAAQYEIVVQNESGENQKTIVTHDQTSNPDLFSAVATMNLPAGSKCSIILRDFVDSTATGSVVVFDAIRFMNTATTEIFNNNSSTTTRQSTAAFSYPNPFNPSTNILYYLQEKSDVEIIIYNALGIIMKEYTITSQAPGDHRIQWNAVSHQGYAIPAGIYIYTVKTNLKRLSGKMIFIK